MLLIQKLRLQRGWSQQQLAELSGLSTRTVQRLEGGQRASVETLKSLAAVFDIEFSSLQEEPDMNESSAQTSPNPGTTSDEILALQHVNKLKRFYFSVFLYLIVVTVLGAYTLITSQSLVTLGWVALGWGVAILARAVYTFELLPIFSAKWEKRQVEKRLGRPL
ncbi:MAG TPA: helix-turn-helix domain-containing protein [Steroidobacteraceae bacterium]|nr:helix-turn-helix domain-containing protein [Steroidobacteraceae bacterium]